MRSLILALALAPTLLLAQAASKPAPAAAPSKGIKWVSIEEAQALAKKAPKPLFVDVYTSWCGPCKMLDRDTFSDPRVADYVNKHFYAVKFNAESGEPVTFKGQKLVNPDFNPANTMGRNGTHQLTMTIAKWQGRIAYPTVVYMDSDLNVLAPIQGYMTPDQIEPILTFFGEGHYKTKDYQSYKGGFKGQWGAQ
jgi:thioredoxin-related protein